MYSETNASSVENLIDKIAQFAGVSGWTVIRNNLSGANRTVTLRKSGDYIHIWNSSNTQFEMRGSTGYNGSNPPNTQPGVAPRTLICNCGAGPFPNLFMFSDDAPAEHVHVSVEIDAARFRHVSFGELQKIGSYTGGTYYDAVMWTTSGASSRMNDPWSSYNHVLFGYGSNRSEGGAVRCDHDSHADFWAHFAAASVVTPNASGGTGGEGTSSTSNYGDGYRMKSGFYDRSVAAWTGRTPLKPIVIRLWRPGNVYANIGVVPNIRLINMAYFTPGEETTIGTSDVWKIFPVVRQGNVTNEEYSRDLGFAFKKVV